MRCVDLTTGCAAESFLSAALRGLRAEPKAIPPKYLYDSRGSELFEEICRQPEYYPTRTEIGILRARAREICEEFPDRGCLIELGSGASVKTEILLDALAGSGKIRAYLPFDISKEFLLSSARRLRARYPGLKILPICGDFADERFLGASVVEARERLVFLPGSTLGNFDPPAALRILRAVRRLAGYFLVGIDLQKDAGLLEAAYNDAAGVTARFNKNLLTRLATEGRMSLDPEDFAHEAFYRQSLNRIEMHLVARRKARLRLGGEEFLLEAGESIHTENSYKYTLDGFEALTRRAGFDAARRWTDPAGWFAVFLLRSRPGALSLGLCAASVFNPG